jgi:hypothetical protein
MNMDIDGYVDGIIELLASAGVPRDELEHEGTRDKCAHMFMKGVEFTVAARAACRLHNVEVEE